MIMSELFIESHDLDWFAINDKNFIAHFATGGTDKLPSKLKTSKSLWEQQFNFFNNLPGITEPVFCENNLPIFDSLKEKEEYLESFAGYAKKGIFSYDIDFDSLVYKLIAFPKNPTKLNELPIAHYGRNDLTLINHNYDCSSIITI